MKKTRIFKRLMSISVCIVLIAATGLMLTSCGSSDKDVTPAPTPSQTVSTKPGDGYGSSAEDRGTGKVSFIFRVTDDQGYDSLFRIHTDEKYVGQALMNVGLIAGEEGDYGLYVKVVNGITADYDTDKAYWAFYVNNEYAMTGVDKTEVKADAEYHLKYTKDE